MRIFLGVAWERNKTLEQMAVSVGGKECGRIFPLSKDGEKVFPGVWRTKERLAPLKEKTGNIFR